MRGLAGIGVVAVWLLLAACTPQQAAIAPQPDSVEPEPTAEPPPEQPDRTDTESTHSGLSGEVKARDTQLRPGVGRCRVDDDCVLTSYREGCCAPSCEPYASSKSDLAARTARENCKPYRSGDKLCPPPAPCPRSSTHTVAARCVSRTCNAVVETVAGPDTTEPLAPPETATPRAPPPRPTPP